MTIETPEMPVNPGPIMGVMAGYWQVRLLLAAVEHDVFSELSGRPATSAELAGRLGLVPQGTHDLLAGLSHLGLLALEDGKFANSATAEVFLVRDRTEYLGGYLQFCDQELNPAWDGLPAALRTGKPQNPAAVDGNPYDTLYQDAEATDGFLDSMDLLTASLVVTMSRYDWSRHGSFIDIGGARGSFAHRVVSQNPHLTGAVFDLPPLKAAFARQMEQLGELPFADHLLRPFPRRAPGRRHCPGRGSRHRQRGATAGHGGRGHQVLGVRPMARRPGRPVPVHQHRRQVAAELQ
jgi:hypothetical protein